MPKHFVYKNVVNYFLEEAFKHMKDENCLGCDMTVGTAKDEQGNEFKVVFSLEPKDSCSHSVVDCESFTPMIEPD
jgi:hypothetical protein